MADHVQPGATGDEQEVSSSGLLLSVDPLPGTAGYKLSADDNTDDGSDATDLTGGDTDATDAADADGSDTLGDTDSTDTSDADGTDLTDSEVETESGLGGVNPLGINRPERVKNGDDKDTKDT